ncbi:MAG: DUF1080 domain-containing protein [Caldilinea sp. CFX5]|nr:DUF1080 domain-containing protein [Caldilinea sp. CFX5]
MQTEPLSLRLTIGALLLALLLWLAGNSALFLAIYGDTLTPLTMPYQETFTDRQRLDYRQFGGRWRLQEQTLVQSNPAAADDFAVIPLPLAPEQTYQFGAYIKVLEGANGAGLAFNMQQTDDLRQSHLVRLGANEGQPYLVFGYFDENDAFVEQGTQPSLDLTQGATLQVLVQDDTYTVFLNDQIQQEKIPLHYQGGHVGLTTWFSSVAFDDVAITVADPDGLAEAAAATAPTVLLTQNFADGVDRSQWQALSGEWQFTDNALVQQKARGFDYTISHATRFEQFVLRVRFRHEAGKAGGGILFNRPDRETPKRGHMVRYDQGQALIWGYFDEQGEFVAQGYQAVAPPGDQAHTLQITSDGNTYAILLDETVVVADVPLISRAGHIGLTTAQSVVAFESVEVTAFTPVQGQTK